MSGLRVQLMQPIETMTEDRKGDVVVFTDGSVKRGSKFGWQFNARDGVTLVRVMEKCNGGDNVHHVRGSRSHP